MSRTIGMAVVKLGLAALLVSPFLLVGTACNPECVDKYDCLSKSHALPDGGVPSFQCVNDKCNPVTEDAGRRRGHLTRLEASAYEAEWREPSAFFIFMRHDAVIWSPRCMTTP